MSEESYEQKLTAQLIRSIEISNQMVKELEEMSQKAGKTEETTVPIAYNRKGK